MEKLLFYPSAIVYGNEPGSYLSGDLKRTQRQIDNSVYNEKYAETIRRAKECNILPKNY